MGVRPIFSHLIHSLFHSRCFVHPKQLAAAQVNRARPVAPGSFRSTGFMDEMQPEPGVNVVASPMSQPSDISTSKSLAQGDPGHHHPTA